MKHCLYLPLIIGNLVILGCAAQPAGSASAAPAESAKEALSCLAPSNCVNSLDDYSSLTPLRFVGSATDGKARLMNTLAAFPEARVVSNEALQVEAVFTTSLGFRDQVLFRVDAAGQRIDFRSRSNVGLYDFGKNRSRMREFSARFEKESEH